MPQVINAAESGDLHARGMGEAIPKDAVRISGHENPLGPYPEAREAIYNVAGVALRR